MIYIARTKFKGSPWAFPGYTEFDSRAEATTFLHRFCDTHKSSTEVAELWQVNPGEPSICITIGYMPMSARLTNSLISNRILSQKEQEIYVDRGSGLQMLRVMDVDTGSDNETIILRCR
jgi:hypothetical protein